MYVLVTTSVSFRKQWLGLGTNCDTLQGSQLFKGKSNYILSEAGDLNMAIKNSAGAGYTAFGCLLLLRIFLSFAVCARPRSNLQSVRKFLIYLQWAMSVLQTACSERIKAQETILQVWSRLQTMYHCAICTPLLKKKSSLYNINAVCSTMWTFLTRLCWLGWQKKYFNEFNINTHSELQW